MSGRVFGSGQFIKIKLLSFKSKVTQATALKYELEDAGFRFLKSN